MKAEDPKKVGDEHVILEIATLVTDGDLNILAEGPEIAIYRSADELKSMEEWSAEHHKSSGLLKRVNQSSILQYLMQYMLFPVGEWPH